MKPWVVRLQQAALRKAARLRQGFGRTSMRTQSKGGAGLADGGGLFLCD